MAYQKTETRSYTVLKIMFGVIIIAGLGYIAYSVWYGSPTRSSKAITTRGEGGQIAQLSGNKFVAGANTDQPSTADDGQQTKTSMTTAFSDNPYTMNLPAEWELTNSVTELNQCDSSLEQVIDTYKNGETILNVYTNGSATGCDNTIVGDLYYDFDFSQDNTGIRTNTSERPPFCTKETNPTCPKGDGKLTVFVGNTIATDPNKQEKNKITAKTYFFTIETTKLENDLDTQSTNLAKIAESMLIN